MIEFFDTTVLVAAMVEDERRHEACARVLEEAKDGFASVHSLAECYATLTGGRLGLQQRIYTLNHGHFKALAPDLARWTVSP